MFPALAIAEELKKLRPRADFLFIGTRGKIETRVVPDRGYRLTTIWLSGIRRSLAPGNLLVPLKILVAVVQSYMLIRRVKPSVVIGTGGYVCGPILYVASLLGVPTVIHESNSYPGFTTRLLARRVSRVFAAFEDVKRWIPDRQSIEIVGTPTLGSLESASREEALTYFSLDPNKKTVLIVGGSLGAASINAAIVPLLPKFGDSGIQCIWQTGQGLFSEIRDRAGSQPPGWIGPFIDRMDLAYAAADVVVCRAGATTIAELTRIGKPAILIPYPYAAADHQTRNAKTLADAGAAVMIADRDVTVHLEKDLFALLQNSAVQTGMVAASRRLGNPNAARRVAEEIVNLAGK